MCGCQPCGELEVLKLPRPPAEQRNNLHADVLALIIGDTKVRVWAFKEFQSTILDALLYFMR